jgi:hypothetical protein
LVGPFQFANVTVKAQWRDDSALHIVVTVR